MADLSQANGKRLCHVITTPTDQYSSGLRTRMEAEIALELGYRVDIVTGQGPADEKLISQGIPGVKYWRLPSLTKYIYPHRDIKALLDLYVLFRRQKYQIVHTHLAKAGILGRLAAGLAGVPTIVHDVHGPSFTPAHSWTQRNLFVNLERLAGLVTTHYVFYTNHLMADFAAHGIGPKAVKEVIYPNLRLETFLEAPPLPADRREKLRADWGLAPEHLVIGYVARLVPSKAHHLVIEALARLVDRWPQARLLLVGGAIWPEELSCQQRLQKLVKNLNLEGKVIFTGHQMEVLPFYQIFDLFVMPSLYECVGNALLEALVMGLPAVAFDLPFVHEFCPHEETIVCPYAQIEGLSQKLEGVLTQLATSSEDMRPSLAFRQDLAEKLSADRWKEKVVNFYVKAYS